MTPAYHVFRHLSPFVDPGANVIGTSGGDALAFKNPDGTIVAVLYNSGAAKDDHRRDGRQEAAIRDARQRLGHGQSKVGFAGGSRAQTACGKELSHDRPLCAKCDR